MSFLIIYYKSVCDIPLLHILRTDCPKNIKLSCYFPRKCLIAFKTTEQSPSIFTQNPLALKVSATVPSQSAYNYILSNKMIIDLILSISQRIWPCQRAIGCFSPKQFHLAKEKLASCETAESALFAGESVNWSFYCARGSKSSIIDRRIRL